MQSRSTAALVVCVCVFEGACEGSPRATSSQPSASATVAPPAPPPPSPRDGCARSGVLDGVENDPSCVVHQVNDDAVRGAMKSLSFTLVADPPEVVAGAASVLGLAIVNLAKTETTVFFEARSRSAGPRTDWSRIAGVPEARQPSSDAPRLFFPMTTLDSYDHDVDAPPTLPSLPGTPSAPTTFAVRLRPGGKLTHSANWWAVRIPAPAPIVKDDAGHRFVPKTTAFPLPVGEYDVVVELPLYGLTREERKVRTRIRVVRPTVPDAH